MDYLGSTSESITELEAIADGLNPGSSALHFPSADSVYDVRQFSSYYLLLSAYNSNTATGLNSLQATLSWYFTNDFVGLPPIYAEVAEFFVDQNGSPWTTQFGPLAMQDSMHGPYLQIALFNPGPQRVSFSGRLLGSSRPIPSPYFRQGGYSTFWASTYDFDGVLTAGSGTLAASSSLDVPLKYGYGRAWLRSNFGGSMSYNLYSGLGGPIFDATLASSTVVYRELVLPKRGVKAQLVNSTGSSQAWNFTVITQFDKP